jgi:hypothetical protein
MVLSNEAASSAMAGVPVATRLRLGSSRTPVPNIAPLFPRAMRVRLIKGMVCPGSSVSWIVVRRKARGWRVAWFR